MDKYMNLQGLKFGRLTALEFVGTKSRGALWLCQCDCGRKKVVSAKILRSGHARSCGCLNREESAKRMVDMHTTHGQAGTRLYKIWCGIKKRCHNPNSLNYPDYGGRGISLCEDWQSFEPFYEWALCNGYCDDLSIDRINNDGNYEPSNCRWANCEVQAHNRRNTRRFSYNGKSLILKEWAEETGVNIKKLEGRIYDCKWCIERAISTP